MSLKEIRHYTLSDLSFYDDAHEIKDEMRDMWCWFMGRYTLEAVQTVVAGALTPKGQKPPEYLKNPILKEAKEKNRVLTEEEKQQQIDYLFNTLAIMQHNFEISHGE